LVDATGSMNDPTKWNKVEILTQTLYKALYLFSPKLKVVAYNEANERCRLTEIMFGGQAFTVNPKGKTASGEAIIATGLKYLKGKRRGLILHITDGASNWGCGVDKAITYCGKNKIKLVTLGVDCGSSAQKSLKGEYGDRVQFIIDVKELPDCIEKLLSRE